MENSLLRPSSVRTYNSLFNKWVVPVMKENTGGPWNVNKLAAIVWRWHNVHNLAPRTIKILIRLLGAEVKHLGVELPLRAVTTQIMRSVQTEEAKALTKEQSKLLLEACKGTELYLPVLLALHTGMRRGEVFGLKWADVDIFQGQIKVQRSYDGPTKNGKSRVVPISLLLEKELLDKIPMKADNSGMPVVPVKFDPNPLLRGACRRAGIEPINFHALRHTFCTLALESGISPRKVSQVAGHTNVSTTLNIYWSVSQEKMDLEFLK